MTDKRNRHPSWQQKLAEDTAHDNPPLACLQEGFTAFEDWWQRDGGYRFGDMKKDAARAAWEWSSVVERSHLRQSLRLLRSVLAEASRLGADKDEPEGQRYIQISDTLASELLSLLEQTVLNACSIYQAQED